MKLPRAAATRRHNQPQVNSPKGLAQAAIPAGPWDGSFRRDTSLKMGQTLSRCISFKNIQRDHPDILNGEEFP